MAFVVFQIEAHSSSGPTEGRHYLRIGNRCSCTCQDVEPIKHVAFRSKQMYSLISVLFSVLFLIEKDILLHFGYLLNIFAGQITGRCRETYHILNDLYRLECTCAHCHSLLRAHTHTHEIVLCSSVSTRPFHRRTNDLCEMKKWVKNKSKCAGCEILLDKHVTYISGIKL